MKKINLSRLDALFGEISKKMRLYVPVEDGNIKKFREYRSGEKVILSGKTDRSAKEFFFPQSANIADFKVNGKKIEVIDTRGECEDIAVFGVRACDAASFSILDRVFLSEPTDTYYHNRREHTAVISLACNAPEKTCFCRTFGIDAASPDGDIQAIVSEDVMYFTPISEKGSALLDSLGELLEECGEDSAEAEKNDIAERLDELPLADIKTDGFPGDMLKMFDSPEWEGLSESCLGCGSCTFVCPTCQCYDIRDFDTGDGVRRFRCWDSCMYSDFTMMASGTPRLTGKERFRQRFMHKLVYYPMNNDGIFGCVGCGRCISKCPVSMNTVKVLLKLGKGRDCDE